MGYLGNEPTTGHFPVQTNLVGPGPTYTLDRAPASAGAIEVSVAGVLQPTTAYSVSGTTLTMAGVASGIPIFIRYLGETLTIQRDVIANDAITTAMIADGVVTLAKMAANSVDSDVYVDASIDDAHLATGISASKLTGTLPAISGANLTGISSIPAGSMIDYGGSAEPTGWVFCDGSAFNSVSDTTYAALFAAIGNTFGGSDGTDFQVPDFRGRVTIGKDNLGGSSANRMTHANADTLGGVSGAETHTLLAAELATHNHTGPSHTHNMGAHTHLVGMTNAAGTGTVTHRGSGGQQATMTSGNTYPGSTTAGGTGATGNIGSNTAHRNDQPWMAITKIIKK